MGSLTQPAAALMVVKAALLIHGDGAGARSRDEEAWTRALCAMDDALYAWEEAEPVTVEGVAEAMGNASGWGYPFAPLCSGIFYEIDAEDLHDMARAAMAKMGVEHE